MSPQPTIAALNAVLREASDHFVTPPLLQPADTFVDLAGEEFRKRLFLTEGPDGEELCLRPDFTIPVCLEHLASGRPTPATYAYEGKVFRKRRAFGAPEFAQAGTEWLGHADEMATDADLFALATRCARTIGLAPRVRVGDANVWAALTGALGLSPAWVERLKAAFGDPDRLATTLDRLARRDLAEGVAGRLAPALASVDAGQARSIVDAVIGLPQRASSGGRTHQDIAERILAQAAQGAGDRAALPVIARYLEVSAPLERAAEALERFARAHQITLDGALSEFAARTDALAEQDVDTAALNFEAAFGRRLDYYTGFVFEMVAPAAPGAEVIAGGRYDRLITLLEPAHSLPAIGFSVWLDRLPA